ncbi:MAG TPA: tetratricopeptide repeat protein [Gammaproteobacteria bacterium]|nr:tetratricopeptide repeat protein [Gammaproteobacteria bacterium]
MRSPFALVLLTLLTGAVVAQPATDGEPSLAESRSALQEWTNLKDDYEARIAAEQSRNGAFSPALVELLVALGLTHQEYGRSDLAVDVLERALQVRRANEGLYSFEQVPLLKQLMLNEAALGRVSEAFELERRMLEVARRSSDDLRSVPIFREAGDRQLALYERYLAGDIPGQLEVNVSQTDFGPTRGDRQRGFGSNGGGRRFGAWGARANYNAAIRSILRNESYGHEDLLELERSLTRSYYLEASERDYPRDGRLHGMGRESYRRRVAYSVINSGEALDFANALVELADWDLLFSYNGAAVDRYDEAYALLKRGNVSEAEIRALFPADEPVRLPTFASNPLAASESLPKDAGYVDVAFEVSKYGVARKIDVVGMSSESLRSVSKDVERAVGSSRFRPRPTSDGDAPFRLRYYVESAR